MKANELRIGNFVSDRLGIVIIGTNGRIEFADIYKPIPLTEEWLVKFGFVKDYSGWQNGIRIEYDKERQSYVLDTDGNDYLQSPLIKHVHRLQNLYFALTGEELEPTR